MEPLLPIATNVNILRVDIKNSACSRLTKRTYEAYAIISKTYVPRRLSMIPMLCCGVLSLSATTIVAVYTPEDISLAADSKGTRDDGKEVSVCKIFHLGGEAYFVNAGLIGGAATNFDPAKTAFRATRNVKRYQDKMIAATRALSDALLAEANAVKTIRPDILPKMSITFMFVGFKDGAPFMIASNVRITATDGGTLKATPGPILECPSATCATPVTMPLGKIEAIQRYLARPHPRIMDSADSARQFVQLEIDDHESSVGGPIDVLRITAAGTQLIQHKPGCPVELGPSSPVRSKPANKP